MKKAIRKITIFSLIILLLSAHIVILGETIANALEIHNEDTNIKNVKYDAYLKTEEGNKYEKQANISERETLVLNVKVNNQGVLRDAKIKIDNTNFNIITEGIESEYIKQISAETNEIELNSIVYSNDVTIEIPIEFKQTSSFTQDYFNKDVPITLTGTYINEVEEAVDAQRIIRLNWTEEPETAFIQDIAKYISLSEEKILIQQNICTAVQNNILPRQAERITIKAQEINGTYPIDVIVIANGEKLHEGINYDEQNGILEISNVKKTNENGEIEWGNFVNEYNVIYTYETEEKAEPITFNLETIVETKLYTKSDIIAKENNETIEVEAKGDLVEVTKESTKDLDKGYMYANSNDETIFTESNTIKISKASEIETIEINNQNEIFVDQNDNKYDTTNSIIYKSTTINKKDLERIFGQSYELKIVDSQNNEIANISNVTESDEVGNITVNYDAEINYIKIMTSKPQEEGNITIQNTRAIKGNTGYTKEELKAFNKIVLNCNVDSGENTAESKTEIILNDTVTEAKMEISNTNLSTAQRNQDVQFLITLLSDSSKYDLYKNPVVDIVLPQELNIDVKKTAQLNFENEVQITKIGMATREDNKKVIRINLEGEQVSFADKTSKGIQIVLMGDIDVESITETKEETIQLVYTNENSDNEQFAYDVPITINAIQQEIITEMDENQTNMVGPTIEDEVGQVESNMSTAQIDNDIEDLSVSIKAQTGNNILKEGDSVFEGQAIKYIVSVTNNTGNDMNNIILNATNTNAIYYNIVEYQEYVYGKLMTKYKYAEDETLTSKELKIEELKAGETKEVNYQISVKEVIGEDKTVEGNIKIVVDGEQKGEIQSITNVIKQGKLKLNIEYLVSEDVPLSTVEGFQIRLNIENIGNDKLENINLEIPANKYLVLYTEEVSINNQDNCQFVTYDIENRLVKFKISKLEKGQKESIEIQFDIGGFSISEKQIEIEQYFTANVGGETYISNEIRKTAIQLVTKIEAVQTTNIKGNTVKDGDNIQFIFKIENLGEIEKTVSVTDVLQLGLNANGAKIIQNNKERKIELGSKGIIETNFVLNPKESVTIIIDTTLDAKWVDGNKIRNSMGFVCANTTIEVNTIELEIEGRRPNNPNNPSNPDNPNNPDNPKVGNMINGVVWVDQNRNGNRENAEPKLSNIQVILLDMEKQKIAEDENGNEMQMLTDEKGSYQFSNLKNGKYIVLFIYDTNKYSVTQYQKEGISETINSDVIATTFKTADTSVKCARTRELVINDNGASNIDAGLVENMKFDFKLDKYVSKIQINNKKGTQNISYNNTKLAKAEIAAKDISNSKVTIEYVIEVTNEGEVPGYVNEIVDYVPKDLKFEKNMNAKWNQNNDGNLYTSQLEGQVILPGETKRVNLILTKTMTNENTGRILNKAEISKTYNEYMFEDIDSKPANKRTEEDDISEAEVIISVKTGKILRYMILTISITMILAGGIYLIKKSLI